MSTALIQSKARAGVVAASCLACSKQVQAQEISPGILRLLVAGHCVSGEGGRGGKGSEDKEIAAVVCLHFLLLAPLLYFHTVATAALDRPLCSNNMATTFCIEANN